MTLLKVGKVASNHSGGDMRSLVFNLSTTGGRELRQELSPATAPNPAPKAVPLPAVPHIPKMPQPPQTVPPVGGQVSKHLSL